MTTSNPTTPRLTYKDIEPIVEYLVKVKAHKETFDCWDTEDIAQEIRIICLGALKKFNVERVTTNKGIINYFGTCVDNRLRNLKRDRYIRFTPPFPKATVKEVEANPEDNPELFTKLARFRETIEHQKKIKNPVSIEAIGHTKIEIDYFEEEILANDTRRYIIENIEDNLRPALIIILDGDKNKISTRVRRRIQESVKAILEE